MFQSASPSVTAAHLPRPRAPRTNALRALRAAHCRRRAPRAAAHYARALSCATLAAAATHSQLSATPRAAHAPLRARAGAPSARALRAPRAASARCSASLSRSYARANALRCALLRRRARRFARSRAI